MSPNHGVGVPQVRVVLLSGRHGASTPPGGGRAGGGGGVHLPPRLTTILHWDRFNQDHVSFWAWASFYFVNPVFLLFLLRANRAASSPGTETWCLASASSASSWSASVRSWPPPPGFAPRLAIDNWPWTMKPLTVRSISSFVAFCGTLLLWVVVDRRYSALQAGVEAMMIGLLVTSVGAAIDHDDFDGPTYGVVLHILALATFARALRRPAPADARMAVTQSARTGKRPLTSVS